MDIRIKKGWLICNAVALAIGLFALFTETVLTYEKSKGFYSVAKNEDPFWYWQHTVQLFHGSLFCLFISAKEYYPMKLWTLMNFDEKTKLSVYQVVFILGLALLFFGSPFYIANEISSA